MSMPPAEVLGPRKRKQPAPDPNNVETERLALEAARKKAKRDAKATQLSNATVPTKSASVGRPARPKPYKKAKTSTPSESSQPKEPKATSKQKASQSKATSRQGRASTSASRQPSIEDVTDDEAQSLGRSLPQSSSKILISDMDDDDDEDTPELLDIEESDEEEDGEDEEGEEVEDEVEIIEAPVEDEEAELNRLRQKWNAPIYAFFKPIPKIQYIKGRRAHVFECLAKSCHGKGRDPRHVNRFLDTGDLSSTSNLRKHAKLCWGADVIAAADTTRDVKLARDVVKSSVLRDAPLTAIFERIGKEKGAVTYSHTQHTKAESKAEIVRWVTENHRPFKIVSDRGFISLMKTGRPSYYIPSPATVSRDVKQVFLRCRERIAKMLQEHEGALSFATDAWTSPNHKAFVALTVHFELKGKAVCMLLDLVEVARSHSGLNLAKAFATVLEEFGISHKILSVTCDNASNNDTMIDELEKLIDSFPGAKNRTRCFTHVINLVAKTLIKQFDVPKKKAGECLDEAAEELQQLATDIDIEEELARQYQDNDLGDDEDDDDADDELNEEEWEEVCSDMTPFEREMLEESVQPLRLILVKLRKTAFAIKNSSTIILPRWFSLLEELKMDSRMMPRDVTTRWNSTFDMLKFAVDYRVALDSLTGERDMKLRKYELSEAEWEIATQLKDVLRVFKDATLFFSQSTPSIATVIPAMDYIDEKLATIAVDKDNEHSIAIKAAANLAKKTLNKYYCATDLSDVYRIAMVLHPRHKLHYFKRAGWEQDWIDEAKEIVRTTFDEKYAKSTVKAPTATVVKTVSKSKNIFDNLPSLSAPQAADLRDELDRYLGMDPEDVKDGMMWWAERRQLYPRLSRMALDYLSIPPTSVDVERTFSQGRIVLSHLRNRLSTQSIRASMCVGVWSKLGYVRTSDIQAVTRLDDLEENEDEEPLDDDWDKILF